LVALVLGYPYFKEKKQYFILSFLFGLWFDLGSYGTFFIEGVLLVCIAFCLHKIWKYCRFHLGNVFLLLLLAILLYEGMHFFLILLFCHIASAIFCGIAFRNFYCDDTESLPLMQNKIEKNALNDCIYSSVTGILTVGAFICLFYMFFISLYILSELYTS